MANHKRRRPPSQRGGCWCKSWKKMPGEGRTIARTASEQRKLQMSEDDLDDVKLPERILRQLE